MACALACSYWMSSPSVFSLAMPSASGSGSTNTTPRAWIGLLDHHGQRAGAAAHVEHPLTRFDAGVREQPGSQQVLPHGQPITGSYQGVRPWKLSTGM